MKIVKLIAIGALAISSSALAGGKAHWGYTGHEAPEHWGDLSPEFSTCKTGANQSPVNLTEMVEGELPELVFDYKAGGAEVINNGHTVQVNYAPGSTFSVDGKTFELKQFHFHAPSENTIEGVSFPMEVHLVHASDAGELAVIALMFDQAEKNKELAKAWKQMPAKAGAKAKLAQVVDIRKLLPKSKDYIRFNGSLTTPPCTEGVNWFVMKEHVKASDSQISQFEHVMHHPNNRPVQDKNSRIFVQ